MSRTTLPGTHFLIAIITDLISSITVYMNVKVIGARKQVMYTIAGKGFRQNRWIWGKFKWLVFSLVAPCFLFCVCFFSLIHFYMAAFMESNGDSSLSFHSPLLDTEKQGAIAKPWCCSGRKGRRYIARFPVIYRGAWNSVEAFICRFQYWLTVIGIFLGMLSSGEGEPNSLCFATHFLFCTLYFSRLAFGAAIPEHVFKAYRPVSCLYGTFTILGSGFSSQKAPLFFKNRDPQQ
jgi:hypothetical protein